MPEQPLTQTAPPAYAGPRFTDSVHAATARMAVEMAETGVERLISNLSRMQVPEGSEHGHEATVTALAGTLQDLRNLEAVFASIAAQQTKEGSI